MYISDKLFIFVKLSWIKLAKFMIKQYHKCNCSKLIVNSLTALKKLFGLVLAIKQPHIPPMMSTSGSPVATSGSFQGQQFFQRDSFLSVVCFFNCVISMNSPLCILHTEDQGSVLLLKRIDSLQDQSKVYISDAGSIEKRSRDHNGVDQSSRY